MVILSKARKPNNFELHNFLKLGFTNIGGLRSNFAASESFLESNSPDILALWETNLIDSGDFSVKGYLSLIRKDSVTCMHSLAVYVKDRLPFARGFITRKLSGFYLFSTCFTSFRLYFSPYRSPPLCAVFDANSSNIDKVLSINPPVNVFILVDFNVRHAGWHHKNLFRWNW